MKTTGQMCARPETRDALHDVYSTSGMFAGAFLTWVTDGFTVVLCLILAAAMWIRAWRAE